MTRWADDYIATIRRCRIPSKVERAKLLARFRAGDAAAKAVLIESCLPFAFKRAALFHRFVPWIPLEDLVSEANTGVVIAAKRFSNPDVQFITYADYWIIQRMQRYAAENRLIAIPAWISEVLRKRRNGQEVVANEECATAAERAMNLLCEADLGDADLSEMLRDPFDETEDAAESWDHAVQVEKVLGRLTKRQAEIVRAFYGIGQAATSAKEIAAKLGVSRYGVQKAIEASLAKMRDRAPVRKAC